MALKAEARGKYPGLKLHLDKEECERLLKMADLLSHNPDKAAKIARKYALASMELLQQEMDRRPDLLEERTEEQIIKELEEERIKSEKKLAAIAKGKEWKGIEA